MQFSKALTAVLVAAAPACSSAFPLASLWRRIVDNGQTPPDGCLNTQAYFQCITTSPMGYMMCAMPLGMMGEGCSEMCSGCCNSGTNSTQTKGECMSQP